MQKYALYFQYNAVGTLFRKGSYLNTENVIQRDIIVLCRVPHMK